MPDFDWMVVTPGGFPDPSLAIAGSRAGAIGVLNLEFVDDPAHAMAALGRLASFGRGRLGVLLDGDAGDLLRAVTTQPMAGLHAIVLTASTPDRLEQSAGLIHDAGLKAYLVATSLDEAIAGQGAKFDAILAKGNEAGGWVGEETTFVLLQRLAPKLDVPVWAYGGVGPCTAAACRVAGAAGAVLDSQLLLTKESGLPDRLKARLRVMDGSETNCLGGAFGAGFRAYSRPDLPTAMELRRLESTALLAEQPADLVRKAWRTTIRRRVDWRSPETSILALGQDAAFAAMLARRYGTVGGVLTGLSEALQEVPAVASEGGPLDEGSPLARSHGTRFPIVQGPMTRVSDRAEFAEAVAGAGALPFLALALMRAPEARALLEETRRRLGDRPWGVGVLGFVPPELRAEQLEVVRAYKPPFALIAGGRPDQAKVLEAEGIATYLHVPSPGLLRMFAKDGARRFVFEGRECGGHVGPRTSFVLWESMIDVLLEDLSPGADASAYHVLFAGGVHDGLSAAMVGALAAPLLRRGVRVGVLVGTAYLFTKEAVETGAIVDGFQKAALSCGRTVLLESGPGHATRCAPSPFVADFVGEKRRLIREGVAAEDLRHSLEELNIGRLRVASKGVDHNPQFGKDRAAAKLVGLGPDDQWTRGMFMIGQVAGLRDGLCSLAELHEDISLGSARRLRSIARPAFAGRPKPPPPTAIAVVGMACILPGAPDLKAFWANILNKVDAITEIPEDRWDWRQYFDPSRAARDKIYSRWGGFIDDVAFDPAIFGMPPSSLRSIEPFQLLALAVVRSALEDAGYLDRPFPRERTSVILGAGGGGADLTAGYMVRSSLPSLFNGEAAAITEKLGGSLPEWTEDSFPGILMNVAAGRVANRFNLGGVNYTVDAACASSLAAIYLAVRDLEARTSDVVVVGGVDAIQNPFAFLCFSKTQALSPSGRCRTFDAEGDGIAISEGFAAVILKRLEDAERDGDRIYSVIRGAGGSSDGRDRSMTAPRPEGQIRALDRAYAQAGYSPATVELIEAHGTGTVAGDQAEITALTRYFGDSGASRQGCAVGSIKSMIGHTKATAGVAGLIKASLALRHRVLPPTLGVSRPNPKANFPESPFYVNTETRPWVHAGRPEPRRAGVSAFGFGGTNFHIALEEYTDGFLAEPGATRDPWPAELFLWRAPSRSQLVEAVSRVAEALKSGSRPGLADLSFELARVAESAAAGGPSLAIVANSHEDLVEKMNGALQTLRSSVERRHDPRGVHFAERPLAADGRIAFLFPGQGSQYVNMTRDLAVAFPEARECFELADRTLAVELGRPLSRWVFPPPVFSAEDEKHHQTSLTETNIAQPALAAADLAILRVLRRMGVEPQMVAGHSFGEFVALCAAGCLDERDLLEVAAARGRFIRECTTAESGSMAAVSASPEELHPLLAAEPGLTLANLNAPRQTVVAGSRAATEKAMEWCRAHGLQARLLPVACAFHSPLIAPAQQKLAERIGRLTISPPRIPAYSNTTGGRHPDEPSAIAGLLADHLVRPVQFVREVESMYEAGARLFVEAGPRQVLGGLVGQILGDRPHVCASFDRPGVDGVLSLVHGLAALASEGVPMRAEALFQGRFVRPIDLSRLPEQGEGPKYSPTTWLVNGGRARPAFSKDGKLGPAPPPRPDAKPAARKPNVASTVEEAVSRGTSSSPSQGGRHGRQPGEVLPKAVPSGVDQPNRTPSQNDAKNGDVVSPGGSGSRAHRPIHRGSIDEGGSMTRSTVQSPRFTGTAQPPPHPGGTQAHDHAAAPALNGHGSVDLARQFQHVMMRFLQTQETVMHDLLVFMGAQGTATAAAAFAPRHHDVEANGNHNGESNGNFHAANIATSAPLHHPAFLEEVPTPSSPVELFIPAPSYVSPNPAQPVPAKAAVATPNGMKEEAPAKAPEPAPAPRAAVVSRPAADAADRRRITEQLLGIVSERTGYPEEMLNLDADLEADLGIDSIKRVEIAGTLVRSLDLPEGQTPDIEKLTVSRTLGQVIDHLESFINEACVPVGVAMEGSRHPFDDARTGHGVGRFALKQVPAPSVEATGDLALGGVVVVVDDETGVGRRLAVHLNDRGLRVVRVVSGTGKSSNESDVVTADLREPEGVARFVGDLRGRLGRVVALIHLSALRTGEQGAEPGARGWGSRDGDLTSLYLLCRALLPDLDQAAARGGAAILAATRMGGGFAVGGAARTFAHEDGALVGFLKSLAHECPTVRIKAVDLAAEDPDVVAGRLSDELTADDRMVEVGYSAGRRIVLESTPAPLGGGGGEVPLDRGSVVLVTGGARGITARATLSLAEAVPCTFLVVGRTPLPIASESAETVGVEEPKAIKRAIMERMRAEGRPVALAAVEERYRRLLLEREVRANLRRIRATGARVEYAVCDVSDAEAFGSLIDEIYRVKGRIDGVVHGAGVIEDRLVKDKTPESLGRVMAVKAGGARVLAERLRLDALRFLVFFSSVSGRFGNRGQADYAAASEVLNKLAQALDRRCPGRIVSINWGPWLETGMVSPEVQRQFAERGVTLIPPDVGGRMLVDELRFGRKGDVEILIGGGAPPSTLDSGRPVETPRHGATPFPLIAAAGVLSRGEDRIELVRSIDPDVDVYLGDHCLDGRPVFPFAMAMELMAEVAATGWPELELLEVGDVRLHRGVVLDGSKEDVRVVARPHAGREANGSGRGPERILDVSILSTKDPHRVQYRATVRLGRRVDDHAAAAHFGGVADPGLFEGGMLKSLRVEEAYRDFLFHGPLFQGIVSIEAFGPRGARAILRPSSPLDCLRGGPSGAWLVDPILVDSAFQMQVLWARLHWDMTLLPARVAEFRLFGPGVARPTTTSQAAAPCIRYELRVAAESRAPTCQADHYFSSLDGRLLGMLTGVEGTGSKALNRLAGTNRR